MQLRRLGPGASKGVPKFAERTVGQAACPLELTSNWALHPSLMSSFTASPQRRRFELQRPTVSRLSAAAMPRAVPAAASELPRASNGVCAALRVVVFALAPRCSCLMQRVWNARDLSGCTLTLRTGRGGRLMPISAQVCPRAAIAAPRSTGMDLPGREEKCLLRLRFTEFVVDPLLFGSSVADLCRKQPACLTLSL